MSSFLELVAEDILKRFSNMQDLSLVFPNRRSILYFNQYLSQKVEKPLWAPRCLTISEFIQSFSTLQKVDNLQLLFELHQVYCETRPSTETFDSFYFWGEVMLSDFDDIDKYLVNAELLFKNVAALKNINEQFSYLDEEQREAIERFWGSYIESRQSAHHKEFSDIWTTMFKVYSNFKDRLRKNGQAYEGMIYREVANTFHYESIPETDVNSIAFIGFNALNECETSIFKYFQNKHNALFYWDYEPEYLDSKHEAGFFIRKNLTNFPQLKEFQSYNEADIKPVIDLISVPSLVGQAKIAGNIFEKNIEAPEKSAILLSDENLLMPVLHALPKEIEDINITMGYPVRNSSLASLIDSLGKLYNNLRENKENRLTFYYKHVTEILTHPYVLKSDPEKIHELVLQIFRLNRIYIEPSLLDINPLLTMIFVKVDNGKTLLKKLKEILQYLALNLDKEEQAANPKGIETEALSTVFITLNRLSEVVDNIGMDLNLSLSFRVLKKVIAGLSIPFEGEPLKGIQVMGFLESRALDFENLMILGVNEGNLPKSQSAVSFIPFNLRKGFNLPTPEYRDAMYAYYFYRIIHRAKKVSLIYSTNSNGIGNSEVSRYVTQMLYSDKYIINHKVQTFNIVPSSVKSVHLIKTEAVMEKLKRYTIDSPSGKFLSPSALTTYIECPARFYFRFIEGLKEFEEPSEEIDPAVFGIVLHNAIKAIYDSFSQKEVTADQLKELLKTKELIEKNILKAFDEAFLHTGLGEKVVPEGRNALIYRILLKYVRQIIHYDITKAPFIIHGLESKIQAELSFFQNQKENKLRLGGIIDRIDSFNNNYRIVDYKTGKPDINFKSLEELFIIDEDKPYKKEIFQTILYAILYKRVFAGTGNVAPTLYLIRNLFDLGFVPNVKLDKVPLADISALEEEFMKRLVNLLEELYNPALPFVQTPHAGFCSYCEFSKICNR